MINIIYKPIGEIKPYTNNPRSNDGAVPFVVESIKEYGFRVPILVDKDMVVIAGHTRLKAAIQLGLTELPCIIADDLTPAQVKAYRLMDNKASEKSKWNEELLVQEFEALADDGFDLTKTAFEQFEIDSITYALLDEDEPDDEPNDYPEPDDHSPVSERFSVIICCQSEEEKEAVKAILGIKGDLRRMYSAKEITVMWEESQNETP